MTSPIDSANLKRLSMLKSGKRRVAQPNQLIDELPPEITGGDESLPPPLETQQPLEESNMDTQSTDIRANKELLPDNSARVEGNFGVNEENKRSFEENLSKIGQFLKRGEYPKKQETMQPEQKETEPGILSKAGQYILGGNQYKTPISELRLDENQNKPIQQEQKEGEPGALSKIGQYLLGGNQYKTFQNDGFEQKAPIPQPQTAEQNAGYGKREDGTDKGPGFLGELPMQDGSGRKATELSIGVNLDGKETLIPSIVPTLTEDEKSYLLKGGKPTTEIIQKAVDHAKNRIDEGKSPFKEAGEKNEAVEGLPEYKQGDIQELASNESLNSVIRETLGEPLSQERIQEIESMAQTLKTLEENEKGYNVSLSEFDKQLRDRIQNNELSTRDKVIMGIALLAPALVAGMMGGGEAAFSTLAGGAKGLGDVLGKREKSGFDAQEKIAEVAKERSESGMRSAKNRLEIQKIQAELGKGASQEKVRLFQENGEIRNGKLVLKTTNPLLPLRHDAVQDASDIKRFKEKRLPKLEQEVSSSKKSIEDLKDIKKIIKLVNEKREDKSLVSEVISSVSPNIYNTISRGLQAYIPAFRDEIIWNGVSTKAESILNNKVEAIADNYRRMNVGQGAASKAIFEHFHKQISDVFSKESFLEGKGLGDLEAQANEVFKKFNDALILDAKESGVDTSELEKELERMWTGESKEDVKAREEQKLANEIADKEIEGR